MQTNNMDNGMGGEDDMEKLLRTAMVYELAAQGLRAMVNSLRDENANHAVNGQHVMDLYAALQEIPGQREGGEIVLELPDEGQHIHVIVRAWICQEVDTVQDGEYTVDIDLSDNAGQDNYHLN